MTLARYNQIVIAILVTGLLILALVLGGLAIYQLVLSERLRDVEVVPNDIAVALHDRDLRQELISFNEAQPLWKRNLDDDGHDAAADRPEYGLYLVPAEIVRLDNPAKMSESQIVALNRDAVMQSYSNSAYGYGAFANFVVVDIKTGAAKPIFAERLYLTTYLIRIDFGRPLVIITGYRPVAGADTIAAQSTAKLTFLYDVLDGSLHEISNPGFVFERSIGPNLDHKLTMVYGQDLNGDGLFTAKTEPERLFRYDVEHYTIEPFIASDVAGTVQTLLDRPPEK